MYRKHWHPPKKGRDIGVKVLPLELARETMLELQLLANP